MKIRTVVAAAMLAGPGGTSAGAAGLPNGATTLNETYNAWRVVCQATTKDSQTDVSCVLAQVLTRKGSNTPAFVLRLQPAANGDAEGRMVLPLGVALAEGVTMKIDDAAETAPNPYSTCLRSGCMVPVKWSAKTVAGLKLGGTLTVTATALNGKKVSFQVSLKGFSAAFDRAAKLIAG